jgi:glutamyl-tRNA reductase
MSVAVVGLSHHAAPVELRERVTLDLAAAVRLAESLGDAVCLSTCNRTELYVGSVEEERAAVSALDELAGEPLDDVIYVLHDEAAALHLFRVAAGLDSLVPGEGEILGQVRDAYDAVTPGPHLDRVFRQALAVGKRVRAETAIGESPASVSSAAAALVAQVFGDLAERRVLLIGAGRIGELAAANLSTRGATIAFVANRSPEAARDVAKRFGASPLALGDVPARLAEVDVVVSSTSSSEPILLAADVPSRRRPLFLVDIAVPRDLDPEIGKLDQCFLYDIDDLEAVVAETLSGRRAEAERAERLVADELERYRRWRASLDVVPAIASLRARAEEIRSAELAKVDGRVSDDERRTLDSVTAQILNKLLHLPTVRMKEAAVSADGALYADAVRHLFGLEEERQ